MSVASEVFVNSDVEIYFRLLQVDGRAPFYPWSIRGFSPHEAERLVPSDTVHPWASHFDFSDQRSAGVHWEWIRPNAQMFFNSAFPYGLNDGPVWTGRGLTTAVQAGFSLRAGPLSLVVAPVAFRAENAEFDLAPAPEPDAAAPFSDARNPQMIDLPQRFGSNAYMRIDPGQSTLRLDFPVVTLGVSTANQHWGPASQYPLVIGNNAPGFLHGFLGTSAPLNIGLGRIHSRLVWGMLEQSEYSRVQGPGSRRFMSGLVAVFAPRGLNGLEVGGARFFHTPWPEGGVDASNFFKPFEGLLKQGLRPSAPVGDSTSDADNQIASVFGRWVFPGSGFELYGEYSRDDHSYDMRHLILEPDNASGYMLGFRKTWRHSPVQMVAVRGELLDARVSHLSESGVQVPVYTHGWAPQGHTQRGQIIGSPAAYGGAGSTLAADYYHPAGRWTLAWRRTLQRDAGELRNNSLAPVYSDVVHSIEAEALFFREKMEIFGGVAGVYNLNRNFRADKFNFHSSIGVRVGI